MDLTTCPDCGSIAEVLERFVVESTHGPVEQNSVKSITLWPYSDGQKRLSERRFSISIARM